MQKYCPKKIKCATIACVIERYMARYMHVLVYHRSVNNKVIAHVYVYMYMKQKKYSKLSSISTTTTQGVIRKEGE